VWASSFILTALGEWPPAARPCLPCGMLGGSLVLIRRWGLLVSGIPVARLPVVDEMSNSLLGSEGPGCAVRFFFSLHVLPCQQRAAWETHPYMVVVLVQRPEGKLLNFAWQPPFRTFML